MKNKLLLLFILIFFKISAQTWTTEEQYIQKFAQYAVEEMEKYKIPASITLAQGILETGGGQSRLAREGNNHFGIKCKKEWTGKTMRHTDDAPNECFRVYDHPRDSYEDHSKFLAYRKYYQNLFTLDPKDYKAWAHGLKKAGYATNPKYAYILINKIEKHKLYEFDNLNANTVAYALLKRYPELSNDKEFMAVNSPKKVVETPKAVETKEIRTYSSSPIHTKKQEETSLLEGSKAMTVRIHPNGGKKYIIVPEYTTLDYIAEKFGVRKARIKRYNELEKESVAKNEIIFLENKASSGNTKFYTAKGETMHQIAQKCGIRLKKLYKKNNMKLGSQPIYGQLIKLK